MTETEAAAVEPRRWEPGTAEDLIADAAELGLTFTARTIDDWVESGLVGAPAFQKSTQRGSDPRVFSADQRRLFTELLKARARSPHKRIRADRLIEPVLYLWLADNAVVTDQQARRALRTYAKGMGRLPASARTVAAKRVVDQIAHADAVPALRRAAEQLLANVEKTAYTTRRIEAADRERLYSLLIDLTHDVDLRLSGFERGLGPPQAPLVLAQLFGSWVARLRMSVVLRGEQVTEQELAEARAEHVAEWARYQQVRPGLHAASGGDRMFAAPPDEEEGYRQSLNGFVTLLAGRRGLLAESIAEARQLDERIRASKRAPGLRSDGSAS